MATPERRLFNLLIFNDRPKIIKKAPMASKCVKVIELTIIAREVFTCSSSLTGATLLFL